LLSQQIAREAESRPDFEVLIGELYEEPVKVVIGPAPSLVAQLQVEAVRVLDPELGFEGSVVHSSLTDTQLPWEKLVDVLDPEPEGLVEGSSPIMAWVLSKAVLQ